MELVAIEEIEAHEWDTIISRYESKLVHHQSAWLDFVQGTWGGTLMRFQIIEQGKIVGYFAGLLQERFWFRLFGSPLTGWETDYMGPIVNKDFDVETFLHVLDGLAREKKIHFLQIGNPVLAPSPMKKHGYDTKEEETIVIPLSESEEQMWEHLSSKGRNRIRKGMKNGLVVQDCESPEFVDDYYSQVKEVFKRQNLYPRYPIDVPQRLFERLKADNLLFALRVKHGSKTIANGLFPHDDRNVYSFGIASKKEYRRLCPNELLYWTVMKKAGALGIKDFTIGGIYRLPETGGIFKHKFNGRSEPFIRYSKVYSRTAKIAHELYKGLYAAREFFRRRAAMPFFSSSSRTREATRASRLRV
jgi:hypothetical protein